MLETDAPVHTARLGAAIAVAAAAAEQAGVARNALLQVRQYSILSRLSLYWHGTKPCRADAPEAPHCQYLGVWRLEIVWQCRRRHHVPLKWLQLTWRLCLLAAPLHWHKPQSLPRPSRCAILAKCMTLCTRRAGVLQMPFRWLDLIPATCPAILHIGGGGRQSDSRAAACRRGTCSGALCNHAQHCRGCPAVSAVAGPVPRNTGVSAGC